MLATLAPILAAVITSVAAQGQPAPMAVSDYLNAHSAARAQYGMSKVTDIPGLAADTQAYANTCNFQHSGIDGYGENISIVGWEGGVPPVDIDGGAVQPWMAEAKYYYANPRTTDYHTWGHFTQVVWKDSTSVVCAASRCSGTYFGWGSQTNSIIYICRYAPQGNDLSMLDSEVPPQPSESSSASSSPSTSSSSSTTSSVSSTTPSSSSVRSSSSSSSSTISIPIIAAPSSSFVVSSTSSSRTSTDKAKTTSKPTSTKPTTTKKTSTSTKKTTTKPSAAKKTTTKRSSTSTRKTTSTKKRRSVETGRWQ